MTAEVFSIWRLVLKIIRWIHFYRTFLLWCRKNSWTISLGVLFSFGVENPVPETTAVPCSSLVWPFRCEFQHCSLHFLGVGFSAVNWCLVILWCRTLNFEFGNSAFFFFGIDNSVPEITAAPCTSLVLGNLAVNSTKLAYSSALSS